MANTTTCVQIKLDIETKNKLTELAKKEKRSVANYISVLIDKHLKETK
jgi:predicted DNA-binding protein